MATHAVSASLSEGELPYRPSWVDVLQTRLEASRVWLFAFYVGLPVAMTLAHQPPGAWRIGLGSSRLGVALAGFGLAVFVPAYQEAFVTFTSPLSSAVEATHFVLNWIATTTLLNHSKHQLDVVRYIYGHCARGEIFRLDAVYAFAWLTARTSVGRRCSCRWPSAWGSGCSAPRSAYS